MILFLDNRDKHALPYLPCSSHVFRPLAPMRTTLQFLAGFIGPLNDGTLLNTLAIRVNFYVYDINFNLRV